MTSKSGSKKKTVSVKWKLAYAGIDYLGICWKLMLIFKFSGPKIFFLSGFFFHKHSQFTGQQGKGDAIS